MTTHPPPFTLRELRAHLTAPFVMAAMAGIGLVLGLSGPFGTYDSLPLGGRLAYWLAVAAGSYATGAAVTMLGVARWDRDGAGLAWRLVRGTGLVGTAVLVCLGAINLLAFGWTGMPPVGAETLGGAYAVSAVILTLRELAPESGPGRLGPAAPATAAPTAPAPPPILDRLPLARRGTLVALTVQDHYVEVRTSRGRDLVLMRLGDAIRETGEVRGAQVHRSHWVALDQVAFARRAGDGAVLGLSDGSEVPVSRRYMAVIRDAGLLPARPGG